MNGSINVAIDNVTLNTEKCSTAPQFAQPGGYTIGLGTRGSINSQTRAVCLLIILKQTEAAYSSISFLHYNSYIIW